MLFLTISGPQTGAPDLGELFDKPLEDRRLLEQAYTLKGPLSCFYDEWFAGSDFWFSRQGHGVGFLDRNLGEVGDRLHQAAREYHQLDVLTASGATRTSTSSSNSRQAARFAASSSKGDMPICCSRDKAGPSTPSCEAQRLAPTRQDEI